jgi:hypothetical protein
MTRARFAEITEMIEARKRRLSEEELRADCLLAGDDHPAWRKKVALDLGLTEKELERHGVLVTCQDFWPESSLTKILFGEK